MKKMPQPVDSTADDDVPDAANTEPGESSVMPVLPGTENPRSLGEVMREAELAERDSESDDTVIAASAAPKPRRSKKPSRSQARRFARERALQALYQWDLGASQSTTIRQEFLDNQDMSRVDVDYFILLYNGVSHSPQVLDDALEPCLDRPISDLDPIERSVLRLAAFELSQQADIPARVVINEGIEITKRFGADKGHKYVNGVLDKLAMSLRPLEMKAR